MGQASRESADDEMLEWIRLAERLRLASPSKLKDITRMVREIVEGQEMIASLDQLLVLRLRPTKRYRA